MEPYHRGPTWRDVLRDDTIAGRCYEVLHDSERHLLVEDLVDLLLRQPGYDDESFRNKTSFQQGKTVENALRYLLRKGGMGLVHKGGLWWVPLNYGGRK